jgi:hypothetical protein
MFRSGNKPPADSASAPAETLNRTASDWQQRPRDVYDDPKLHKFESVNFDLLVRILTGCRDLNSGPPAIKPAETL